MTALTFPDTTIHRVFDSLLAKGLCHGTGAAHGLGDYCILQALQLAERGLTPSKGIRDITDTATCVADRPRKLAIRLNDRAWSRTRRGRWASARLGTRSSARPASTRRRG